MSEENKTDSIKLKWSRLLLIGFCSLCLMYLFYIVGLKKLGVEDAIKIKQAAIDRYNARK